MSESTVTLRAVIKDEVSAQIRQIESSFVGLSAGFKGAESSASAYTSGLKSMAEAQNSLYTSIQNEITALKAQREVLQDSGYKKAAAEAAALKKEVQGMTGETQSLGQQWQSLAAKYYIASQAVGVLSSGIMSLVDASKQYEMVRARLNAAEGSSALGGQDFRDVQEMAKKPGRGFQEVATTMATLRGMKVTANEAKQLIDGIAQANASAAGTAEQFGRVMYQIQQSVSTGRLMAEDLHPIMQSIPTLGAAIQEHFGASQAEALNDKLKASGKSVREFWLEVAELGQKLPATGDTITNNLDNISDAWVRLRAALSDTGFFKTATGALAAFLDGMAARIEQKTDEASYVQQARTTLGKGGIIRSFLYGDQGAGEDDVQKEAARLKAFDLSQANVLGAIKAAQEAKDRAALEAARKKEEEDRRRDEAAKRSRESETKRMAAHDRASESNIETNFDNSITLRSGIEYDVGTDPEYIRDREKADKAAERRAKEKQEQITKEKGYSLELIVAQKSAESAAIADQEKMHAYSFSLRSKDMQRRHALEASFDLKEAAIRKDLEKNQMKNDIAAGKNREIAERSTQMRIDRIDADMVKRKILRDRELLEARKENWRQYADVVQQYSAKEVRDILQGQFTITSALETAKDMAISFFAEKSTKAIEGMIEEALFGKATMAAQAAVSVEAATATTLAWAPAALAVTAATFGANATAGMAQYALLQTQVLGGALMPHARGGSIFGPALASREEAFIPLVPGRVVPSHNSTINNNSTTNATNHFHFHGSDEKTILRTLRKAGIDNREVSRS